MAVAIVDPEGNTFAVGLRELKTKSSNNMLHSLRQIFDDVDERIEATAPAPGEAEKPNHILLREIRATMSDRAATQKNLNQQIEDLLNEVIPRMERAAPNLEDEDTAILVKLKNFYCGIHNLVHFAEVMSSAAKEAELAEFDGAPPRHPSSFTTTEASGVALVRKVCKVAAPGADNKNGCHGKIALFLKTTLKEKFNVNTLPFTPFRGHRFNILCFNSEFVFCLRNELVEFLSLNHDNGLTASLLHDLKILFFIAVVRVFAILSKLFTSPLWRMIEDKEIDIVAMGQAYTKMVIALEEAGAHPEVLLEGMI